jgi:hypothetical protein
LPATTACSPKFQKYRGAADRFDHGLPARQFATMLLGGLGPPDNPVDGFAG